MFRNANSIHVSQQSLTETEDNLLVNFGQFLCSCGQNVYVENNNSWHSWQWVKR